MDQIAVQMRCGQCSAYNLVGRVFCVSCRRRLVPLTKYDITAGDYIYPRDYEKLGLLRDTEPLPHLVEKMVVGGSARSLAVWLSRNATKAESRSVLAETVRRGGEMLGLEVLPNVFVAPSGFVGAFTFGSETSPVMVISDSALDILSPAEIEAVVGHELAHIKSEHLLFHALAESLASGAGLVGRFFGAGLVSAPIKMLLLGWYRESEISADRGALLTVGDVNVLDSTMRKLATYTEGSGAPEKSSPIFDMFQTHPSFGRRLDLIREYYATQAFRQGRAKIETRKRVSKALVPFCRFCRSAKETSSLFCDSCGKSQL